MQDWVYYKFGQLASMCLVQGGAGFNILSLSVFDYVCGKDISNIIIPFEDVMHLQAKELTNEVSRYVLIIAMCHYTYYEDAILVRFHVKSSMFVVADILLL